jgi:hypothetical protein
VDPGPATPSGCKPHGGGTGGPRSIEPALVRTAVSRRRRRHDREGGRARGGCSSACGAGAACGDRRPDDRPLPRMQLEDCAVGEAERL